MRIGIASSRYRIGNDGIGLGSFREVVVVEVGERGDKAVGGG